jgi:hypothetical protein
MPPPPQDDSRLKAAQAEAAQLGQQLAAAGAGLLEARSSSSAQQLAKLSEELDTARVGCCSAGWPACARGNGNPRMSAPGAGSCWADAPLHVD